MATRTTNTPIVVVIPARYASTRLPHKPLRLISGVPMVTRTARQALKSGYPVWVAHDDKRIASVLEAESVHVIATRTSHQNGTERLCEVAEKMGWSDETIVVNVQGDEPLLPPQLIERVAFALAENPVAAVATLAVPFEDNDDLNTATTVKVVCNQQGLALYFSRALVPFQRDLDGEKPPYLRHIGIYAYRVSTLKRYPSLAVTPLENAEKLEQLRFLEYGLPIAVAIITEAPPPGVDCEEDLQRIETFLQQK